MSRKLIKVLGVLAAFLLMAGVTFANEAEDQVNYLLTHPEEALSEWQGVGLYQAPKAQENLAQIAAALSEYQILIDRLGKRITKKDVAGLSYLSWEYEKVGFGNWTQNVMASLYELDYLKFLLIVKSLEMKKPAVDPEVLDNYRGALRHKKALYEEYVNSIVLYD